MKKQLSRWEKLVTPSIFDLIVLVLFLAALLALSKINTFDIFWHLKTGDMLLAGTFLKTDVFSYTAFGREWLLHEWGSEVIFSWFHRTIAESGRSEFNPRGTRGRANINDERADERRRAASSWKKKRRNVGHDFPARNQTLGAFK